MKLCGHTVLITGGASGIGYALAERFLRHDNQVIVVGRNETKLNRMKSLYPNVITYVYDLGAADQLNRLVKQIYDHHPELDVLVNNAGVQYQYSFLEPVVDSDRIAEEIAVNLTSPIVLTSKLLPLLTRRSQAAIVNVTSALVLVPKQSAPVYCATKAGLHIYTKALRYQLEHTNVHVFEIIPPLVDTDMTKGRGRNKITPEQLADQFFTYFEHNRFEVPIGKAKSLMRLNRWIPALAEKILKNS